MNIHRKLALEKTDGFLLLIFTGKSKSETRSVVSLCEPMDYTAHRILQARILEWVAFPFSRGSSWPRNQTRVSCISGGFSINWAIRKAPLSRESHYEMAGLSPPHRDLTKILFSTRHTQTPPLTHSHPLHLTLIDQVSEIIIVHTTV